MIDLLTKQILRDFKLHNVTDQINQNNDIYKSINMMKFFHRFHKLGRSQKLSILHTYLALEKSVINICYLEMRGKLYFKNYAHLTAFWAEQLSLKVECYAYR